ncbi:hypothetical protein HanPI659440_Chr01g0020341 [Helianthus annuus]|nr:hypothetical protein HanPI659440_Chr01g0020341 [Helianthus annuus]
MYLERFSWEKHKERLAAEAKLFEQAKAQLAKDKEDFEQKKRSEEWGLKGLKKKLQVSEDTLAEERRKWRVACENENKRMFAVRTENSNLKARVEELKKSEADYKDKYEEAKSHRERVEILQVKAKTAEAAHKVSHAALNMAQENYAEVQSTVEPLITDLGWMQHYGVVHIANTILNVTELYRVVVALTMVARVAGHHVGYVECATHVEKALRTQFGTRHCSVNEGAEEGLIKAEENYDNLALPVIDLVTEALKHDDYVARLRAIFEPPETVQLTDDDDEADDDGAK